MPGGGIVFFNPEGEALVQNKKDRILGLFCYLELDQLLQEHEPPHAHASSPCSWL